MKAYRNAGLWLLSLTLFVALVAGCSKSKSDAQLASEVQSKIQQDFAVPNKQLGVAVANGVVTLNGNVGSEMERAAAANDAEQIEGVRTVVNNLTVSDHTGGKNPTISTTAAGMLNQQQQQQPVAQPPAAEPQRPVTTARRSPSTTR